uniref:Uncharacterized protein n=1 Tax=Schizaphis graminum TaxID=13262 RepID=A0A2S2NLY4_SCHGA
MEIFYINSLFYYFFKNFFLFLSNSKKGTGIVYEHAYYINMSNNTCDAIRHKTKRFSFKRKPFNSKQSGNEPKKDVKKVNEYQEPQEHHRKSEVDFHNKPKIVDDKINHDHIKQTETITQDDNSKMVIKILK